MTSVWRVSRQAVRTACSNWSRRNRPHSGWATDRIAQPLDVGQDRGLPMHERRSRQMLAMHPPLAADEFGRDGASSDFKVITPCTPAGVQAARRRKDPDRWPGSLSEMEPPRGIEPLTYSLRVNRSAD